MPALYANTPDKESLQEVGVPLGEPTFLMRLLLPLGCCDHVKKFMSAGVSERLLLEGAVEIRLHAHAGAFLPARSLFVTQCSLLITQPSKWTALYYFISNS